jgi:hypothetical protein
MRTLPHGMMLWAATLLTCEACGCGKRSVPTAAAVEIDAGPVVLVPMPEEDAAPPAPPKTPVPVAPGGLEYTDDLDLPEDAGSPRCSANTGPKRAVSVRLEHVDRGRAIDLVIAETGLRKRVTWTDPVEPISCYAARKADGSALTFRCSEDEAAIAGKVYARGSDLIVGTISPTGTDSKRLPLPCGQEPRFEPVRCVSPCGALEPGSCACLPAGVMVVPPPTAARAPTTAVPVPRTTR